MKKRLTIIIVVGIVIIVLLVIHHHKKIIATRSDNSAAIVVRVAKPLQQTLATTVTATGSLVADKSTIITPRASGYIRSIAFQEGQTVKAGQVLFQLDSQTQRDALTAAQAAYALSQLQFERNKIFLKKGFITQDLFYSSKVALKQNQAALQIAETNLSDRIITAPFDGTLGSLSVSLGDLVNPGNTLTTLVDNQHLRVEYALPVKELNHIKLNQTIDITDALGKNTLLIPEESVLASINGYHVFTVKNNKAINTPVKMGDRINGNVIIKSGLTSNDVVIIAGENQVKNGVSVTMQTMHTHTDN